MKPIQALDDAWDQLLNPRIALRMRSDLVTVRYTVPLDAIGIDDVASPADVSNFLTGATAYVEQLDPQKATELENIRKIIDFVNHKTVIPQANRLDFYDK